MKINHYIKNFLSKSIRNEDKNNHIQINHNIESNTLDINELHARAMSIMEHKIAINKQRSQENGRKIMIKGLNKFCEDYRNTYNHHLL